MSAHPRYKPTYMHYFIPCLIKACFINSLSPPCLQDGREWRHCSTCEKCVKPCTSLYAQLRQMQYYVEIDTWLLHAKCSNIFSGVYLFKISALQAWRHCRSCGRCCLPDHPCGRAGGREGCFNCGSLEHKHRACPLKDTHRVSRWDQRMAPSLFAAPIRFDICMTKWFLLCVRPGIRPASKAEAKMYPASPSSNQNRRGSLERPAELKRWLCYLCDLSVHAVPWHLLYFFKDCIYWISKIKKQSLFFLYFSLNCKDLQIWCLCCIYTNICHGKHNVLHSPGIIVSVYNIKINL